jgi:hypothetical protein
MDFCVCLFRGVLSCVYVAALRRADPPSKESYRLCIALRNWKTGQDPKAFTFIEREKKENLMQKAEVLEAED